MASTGTLFEKHVRAVCETYAVQGRAYIEKTDPPVKVIGFPKRRIIMLANPFLDFLGTWGEEGGQTIVLECKSTKTTCLPIGNESGVTGDQIASLRRWQDQGAAACVLWEHGPEVRLVTVEGLERARASNRKSVPWKDAEPIPAQRGVSFDFLATLKKCLAEKGFNR